MANLSEIAQGAEEVLSKLRSGPVDVTPQERDEAARRAAEAESKRVAEEAATWRQSLIARALPPKLCSVAIQHEQTPAVTAALGWFGSPSRGLMIRGGIGVGKSAAAAVVVARSVAAGKRSVSWHRPNDFVSAILHAYDDNAPALGEELVVIDDVGRETKADFAEALCAFIDDHAARFILTTNLQREEFRARYDLRLVDRLNECAKAVSIKGDSRRRQDGGF